MIEQTELVVSEWIYIPPINFSEGEGSITSQSTLDVMKKTAPTKKGVAFRFSCKFLYGNDPILLYVGEDSYVIDLIDQVDSAEVLRMLRNSYSKFNEKFELRKIGTVLQDKYLPPFDESRVNINVIVPLLK